MHTITQRMNEVFNRKLEEENELLSVTNAFELIESIKPIKPLVYYHRLIAELFSESEFAQLVKDDYSTSDRNIIAKRNELIRAAINDNIHSNSIVISPNIQFIDNVDNVLTRNDKGRGISATGLTREKCFLVAFAFNLTFEQLEDLMFRCLGHSSINYKNPYEVMIVYCTLGHTNVYEHYCKLKNAYESKLGLGQKTESSHNTLYYKNMFEKVDTDDELVKFLLTLPDSASKSALNTFKEVYSEIVVELKAASDADALDEAMELSEKKGDYWSYYDIEQSKEYKARCNKLIDCKDIVKHLFGDAKKETGSWAWLKKGNIFTTEELKSMLAGEKTITKEHMLLLVFYKYILCGGWNDWVSDFEDGVLTNDKGELTGDILKRIYEDFSQDCNYYLENAGFSDCYLPDALTRILIFCLLTKDPLETFKIILSDE